MNATNFRDARDRCAYAIASALVLSSAISGCHPTAQDFYPGTWACNFDDEDLEDGGVQMQMGTLVFVKNADGTFSSTEDDDAGVLPCSIHYTDQGPNLAVSNGQTCVIHGVESSVTGPVTASDHSMDMNLSYFGTGATKVSGFINVSCFK